MGRTWGMGDPRFAPGQIIEWSKSIIQEGGAITWDTPVQNNGLINFAFMQQLKVLGDDLKKVSR